MNPNNVRIIAKPKVDDVGEWTATASQICGFAIQPCHWFCDWESGIAKQDIL